MNLIKIFPYQRFILSIIFLILLSACAPYPKCNKSENCFIFGENQKIIIPLIIPKTGSYNLLSLDIQKAFELAFQENSWFIDNVELSIEDNFDAQMKNIEELVPYLEKTEVPVIFNIAYSERNMQFYNLLENSRKAIITSKNDNEYSNNVLPVLPGNQELFNRAFDSLPDFVYTKDLLLISDYLTLQNEKIAQLCKSEKVTCQQIDSINDDLKDLIKNQTYPIILISEKQLILNWLSNYQTYTRSPIFVLDTTFANPSGYTVENKSLYWIGSDIWFDMENNINSNLDSSNYKWEFTQSYIAYQIFQDVFQILESHLSKTQNGFRQIKPNQLMLQLKNELTVSNYNFHIYQIQNGQFIMSEPDMLN